MTKKVSFGAKPQSGAKPATAENWVSSHLSSGETMKRLTIDVSENLHRRIKVQCAARGTKIADEIRALLEKHFPA